MKILIIEILNVLNDIYLFLKYSFKNNKLIKKEHYEAYLFKQYHIVEKGLSLPNPRIGFGEARIRELITVTNIYIKNYGEDQLTMSIISTLENYIFFNDGHDSINNFISYVGEFVENKKIDMSGGRQKVYKKDKKGETYNFEEFFKNRSSIRDFENTEIKKNKLIKAVDIAKYSPSVCNRQGWKTHVYEGGKVQEILRLQYGSRGFLESVKSLIIITGDINYFTSLERNQIGIDGGLFSMSLMLALESLNIGCCPLNACLTYRNENRIKEISQIPKNERVIMFLAVGNLKDEYYVAKSKRRSTTSFIKFH